MANPQHTPDDIVIVGAARTPTGRFLGGLSSLPATALGAIAIKGALEQAGVNPDRVDAVVFGQVLQAGAGQNPTKQAALGAGVPQRAHTNTVNKVCLSGLTAIIDGSRMLKVGDAEVVVAGGMESMSNAPHLLSNSRTGTRYGAATMKDHMESDGLTCARLGISMGELTETHADRYPVTRQEQDSLALHSHQAAHDAWEDGTFDREVVPVTVSTRKGETVVSRDEGIRAGLSQQDLDKLSPAFVKDGSITVAHASQISDGASAVVLTRRGTAQDNGWPVLATVCAAGQVAGPDSSLQAQPANAIEQALARQGWSAAELDHVEINEAFADVVIHSARQLGVDMSTVNPAGGALALGHPIGASGARLVVHAAHRIAAGKSHRAAVGLCGGGGQGEALLLEDA
ncbi:acetyl-CoA C-acyltransferase [Corynebacterium aquilae]|uniref:Probable acetyl-CoA acetyltransferase n=1 Tax=Corynebacterium aquilae DSM 44791 TaxID=1431546 RepID=A0A1L7CI09_9CORY|nr:acetyl-CoA C-acyltransferase [Corynebacterium aquilae]APT85403.1 acetyl-CoA acetyltransferase [Corynebacterium aquilae DSM 44791]